MSQKEFQEGKEAYYKLLCPYNLSINPYKDSKELWATWFWQCGYQQSYFENTPPKVEVIEPCKEKTVEYSFRSEAESTGIDRYFGRGC